MIAVALRVSLTILGLAAISRILAATAPPEWRLGELILLGAFIVLVRECVGFREGARDLLRCRDPFAGTPADYSSSGPYVRAVSAEGLGEPDSEQAPPVPQAAANQPTADGSAEISAEDSVEEIAHVMVTQAFRKVSLKYHPDHGGDPEIMRRVYEAREMMLRAIRRN